MPELSKPLTPNPNPLQSNPNPLIGKTDFSKIANAAPLASQMSAERPQPSTRIDDPIQDRREDRVKRENLLRYYDAEFNHAKRELTIVNKDLGELENKIRNEEKEIDLLEEEQSSLRIKLARTEKSLRRFKFELRVHKGDQMDKRVIQRRWQDAFKEAEAKLKKIKYGDWRSLRR